MDVREKVLHHTLGQIIQWNGLFKGDLSMQFKLCIPRLAGEDSRVGNHCTGLLPKPHQNYN